MTTQRFRTKDKVVDLKAIKHNTLRHNYYLVKYQTSKGAVVEVIFHLLEKAKELIASLLGLCVDQLNDYKVGWR
jgi:hypothetical protein